MFKIKIIDSTPIVLDGIPCANGEIQIGDFLETFPMSLEWWTLQEYQQQWKEGIERITTHKRSCLITYIQNLKEYPWVDMWVLYKDQDKVHIQNHIFFGKSFVRQLIRKVFTRQTCYEFIRPRRIVSSDGTKLSEWTIDLADVENIKWSRPKTRDYDMVEVKSFATQRVGIDAEDNFVVFHFMNNGNYHGHVVAWDNLTNRQKQALIHNNMTDIYGNILINKKENK